MTTDEPGLRERKKRQTQRDLQQAALDLVSEHGFEHVTIDDIAAAAAVSKTTFYRYFATKEDVLLGNRAEKLEFLRFALAAQPDDAPALVAVHEAVLAVARQYQADRRQKVALARIMRNTPSVAARNLEHDAAWEQLLREHFARREPGGTRNLRPWILAATVVAALHAAVDYWVTRSTTTSLPDVVDAALRHLVTAEADAPLPALAGRR